MLLFYFLLQVHCGTIYPGTNPIQMSISNRYLSADYTFNMTPSTSFTGFVDVVFPAQYVSGLGIDLVTSSTCSVVCSISGFTVTFTTSGTAQQPLLLTVYNVTNPEPKGGTSNFIVRSKSGQNIFDENLIFGTVGISDYAQDFNSLIVEVDVNSTSVVGQAAFYDFLIKPPITLPAGFYLLISTTLSSDLSTCKFIQYNGTLPNYALTCVWQTYGIMITGFQSIAALTAVQIQINFVNPSQSGSTGTFRVIAYRQSTTMIYAWRDNITGVYIQAGGLINATLVQEQSTAAQVNDFTVNFTTMNSVPSTGSIVISVPINYAINYGTAFDKVQIITGIVGGQITFNQTTIVITKFSVIAPITVITITWRGSNPQIVGLSGAFIIQTLQNTVIDQVQLYLNTTAGSSINPTPGTLSNPSANSITNLQFTVTPNKLTAVKLVITIPWTVTSGSCVPGCAITGQIVSIPVSLTLPVAITLNGIITNPSSVADKLIYFNTQDGSGNVVEYGSVRVQVNAVLCTTATFKLVSSEVSTTTIKRYSTLSVTFTNKNAIPANVYVAPVTNSTNATNTTNTTTTPPVLGQIWITFGPLLTWSNTLGMTTVDCQTNLVAMNGTTIQCSLIQGSLSTLPYIIISNFAALAVNTAITISIPGIYTPIITTVVISAYSGTLQYSQTIPLDYATATLTLQANQGKLPIVYNNGFSMTSMSASTSFTLTFTAGFTQALLVGYIVRVIFPTYGTGFFTSITTCQIDTHIYPCVLYNKLGWIEMTVNVSSATPTIIQLNNLQWPTTSYTYQDVYWTMINNLNQEIDKGDVQQSGSFFPAPTPNDIVSTIIQYNPGIGYSGQVFIFQFTAQNPIPKGSIMSITFPSEFNLGGSTPTPTCNGYVNTAISIQQAAGVAFNVTCIGIKTPSSPPANSIGWSVSVYYQNQLMNQRSNFFTYTYGNLFTPGIISVQSINAIPINKLEQAVYSIQFTPQNSLLSQAQIWIQFPSNNFPELPYPPNIASCSLTGAINSFQSCLLDGSYFKIILNTDYTSGALLFTVNNIINPNSDISAAFVIQTYYDSQLIDQTDSSTIINRTITYSAQAAGLAVNSFNFAPQNTGVMANYYFNISIGQQITSSQQIVIAFPSAFDQRLGDNLFATINSATVSMTVVNRLVYFQAGNYGKMAYINIGNIMNPNTYTNSGMFRIGIVENGIYTFYNNSVGVLEMASAPGWAFLSNISVSNQYSRWQATYQFTFTLYYNLPAFIQINFPSQYDIQDGNTTCNFKSCYFVNNILYAYGNPQNGLMTLSFNVLNPTTQCTISQYQIKSQKQISITEQSYPNLDIFGFQFTYSGPLISINGDSDIIAYIGTETPDILFTVIYPMALNLTFQHTQNNIIVYPKDIIFNYTKSQATMRVRVPATVSPGLYYIYWTTIGELSPPIYTPVIKSRVLVKSKIITPVLSQIYPIPNGGNSLTITLTLPNAPVDGMKITIQSNDATLNINNGSSIGQIVSLNYQVGVNQQSFRLEQNYTQYLIESQAGTLAEIDITLSFKLSNSLYNSIEPVIITYIPATGISPNITLQATPAQTSVQVVINVTQIVEVFYMVCLNQSVAPSLAELISLGPSLYLTTQSQYFVTNANFQTTVTIDLQAQGSYALYAVARNRESLTTSSIAYINFTTLARNRIAEFTLTMQTALNAAQIINVLQYVAFALSLPQSLVVQKVSYTKAVVSNSISIQIVPFNDTLAYPSPLLLIGSLQDNTIIKRFLPGTTIGPGTVSTSAVPIITTITLSGSYTYDCEISVTLSGYGQVFGVASKQPVSSPFQIFKGLDNRNRQIPSGNKLASNVSTSFNVSNLEPNQTYSLYIIAANDFPIYPDLAVNVSTLQCTTNTLQQRAPYYISYGQIIIASLILIY